MVERSGIPLSELTTLRLGGPAKRIVDAETEADLIDAVRECDSRGEPVLVLGGGSNLVVADEGFEGTVVRVATRGVDVDSAGCEADDLAACGGVIVTVAAGESWDELVERAVGERWVGIEALSGIPGAVGATPMQNVGAYGQDVAQTIWTVRTYDRVDQRVRTFANADCRFEYRKSRFKGSERYVILSVSYQLRQGTLGAPVGYAELARKLGVQPGERAPLDDVRAAVLELRRRKGMVLDAADHDTWSAGSFFTNPVLDAADADRLPEGAPRWSQPDGKIKTSAAWLIEHAGFGRGYPSTAGTDGGNDRPDARVSLSTKHTLALTNRGGASTDELLALAREIRACVRDVFGIELTNEPVLVGCTL
ncbi:UDP-N-acetylmuramate dehydrogenase [Actinobacteria bacterium YIM 96077]|uniref:UDP-N-acetylenolpyruvoylglucosamine reductase n=1 Tax=Phytoactinopolyspora halophila TaxID=1981511 RepID=A0A329QBF6_9ACTN|nr:UDP-N-acetylmuramate dehydrogenase [Phytoactinopolyspora halophila]AYY14764.1 UDP-N-acetylmuramate dehydrogenase [Actinobacteria bacterium YIM 96077]RAW09674.1 UDP-N-acetylmuramate dehydrogenase [Phytoactinopolyspora halophila]